MRLFSCAAKPEYEFVRDTFGYPQTIMLDIWAYADLIFFIRYRRILTSILVAPTWRNYLYFIKGTPGNQSQEFLSSDYYQKWELTNQLSPVFGADSPLWKKSNLLSTQKYAELFEFVYLLRSCCFLFFPGNRQI